MIRIKEQEMKTTEEEAKKLETEEMIPIRGIRAEIEQTDQTTEMTGIGAEIEATQEKG